MRARLALPGQIAWSVPNSPRQYRGPGASVFRQRILDGELRPGTPLQELSLAASLGVSRNTMREALRILALEGLLRRNLHRGVVVSQLSLRDLQEIYHLRRMLEIPAILSARKPDPEITQSVTAGRRKL